MKTMSSTARLSIMLALVLATGGRALAEMSIGGSGKGVNAAFMKLFGDTTAFTAKVETHVLNQSQGEMVRMPMEFAALDGKVRLEIDMAKVQSKDFSPSVLAQLKQAGMDRVVSIFRPDKKITYSVYPGIQSYVTTPLPDSESEGLKLQTSEIGKEKIDGHACIKNKVTVTNTNGTVLEGTTWNASDLKGFPVQIEMKEKTGMTRMTFKDIHFVKPDAKQFDPPATYGPLK